MTLSTSKVWETGFSGLIAGQMLICHNFTTSKESCISYMTENTEVLKQTIIIINNTTKT